MTPRQLRCGALLLLSGAGLPVQAGLREDIAADVARSPVHQGLLRQGEQTADDHGDLDGDGRHEAVVTYRVRTANGGVFGVVVVYRTFEAVYRASTLLAWAKAWPVTVGVVPGQVRLEMRAGAGDKMRGGTLALSFEKRLDAQRTREGVLLGVKVWASSTLSARRARTRALALVDGELSTGWAEGAHGTGISEKVRLTFLPARDIALLGIAGGNNSSEEAFELSNRVGRAELRILTLSEEGDPEAGLDYAAMGLAFSGQKERLELSDRPGLTFVAVNTREVRHLELKIESVFLGDRFDDLWIAELVPVTLLPTLDLSPLRPPTQVSPTPAVTPPGFRASRPTP